MIEIVDKIQLVHFFLISYLISRVFVKHRVPERIVHWMFETKRLSINKLTWLLISGTALLSMIIANVITLLTLLPLILILQKEHVGTEKEHRKFSTLILLALVWGANIGGMGMLTGTTTNGILVGMFEIFKFPEKNAFTFLSWMTWGVPLVFVLCMLGWLILMLVFRPNRYTSEIQIKDHFITVDVPVRVQRIGLWQAFLFLTTSSLLSFAMSVMKKHRGEIYILTSIWTLCYLYFIFIHKYRSKRGGEKVTMITDKDILHDIPKKGLLWIGLGVLITAALVMFKFPELIALWSVNHITAGFSVILLYLVLALITTFTTEIVSNSVVQISMFMALFPLSRLHPEISWQMMLIITLTSTCAFMTPIATPSNGLGYGSSEKVSLKHMLAAGFFMNIGSGLIITLWIYFIVPIILSWFK